MTTFDRIKELSKKQGTNPKAVALELGFGENLFYKWKTSSPTSDKLESVANYFHVSTDYLLGRTDNPNINNDKLITEFTEILDNIETFNGKPLTDRDKEIIQTYLEGKFSDR